MDITIVEDIKKTISRSYGVLCEDEGVAFRLNKQNSNFNSKS